MDRINTATKAVDLFGAGKHGYKDGNLGTGVAPTDLNAAVFNGFQEELIALIEGAGIAASGASLTQVRQAIKRLLGGNVTIITAAGPTALTADNAGVVILDASANAVAVTLPAVNAVTGVALRFDFARIDSTGNAVTVSRAGADTFVGGATSFTLTGQGDYRAIAGDATSKWATRSAATSTGLQQAGEVAFFARNSAPTGFIKANGATISRTTYAALFAAIGTTFGAGDGSTTFVIPDLRGEFLRAWDDSRGVDSGRGFGTAQADLLKKHMHRASTVTSLGGGNIAYTPTDYGANEADPDEGVDRYSPAANGFGAETRPRNIALLACIKY